jgi:tyrosinase
MGNPDTAAQDPIFYLHHANIDRLWVHWIGDGRQNPTDNTPAGHTWLTTSFPFFDENGNLQTMTGQDVLDTIT